MVMEVPAGEKIVNELSAGDTEGLDSALAHKHVSYDTRIGKDGFTLLHWCCYYGLQDPLHKLLLLSGNISIVERHGWTPIHICAIQGHNNCLKILLKHGADVHVRDKRGYTCGHLASAHGNTYSLKTILEFGYKLESKDAREWTAIHHAAFHGRYGAVQLLAKWGSNLLASDEEGNTPAHLAAGEGHIDCLRVLVYYDHTPLLVLNSRNDRGATPKDMSVQFQKQDCTNFLSSARTEGEMNEEAIDEGGFKAVNEGNIEHLSTLILEGHCDINDMDKTRSTLAHKAAGNGHVKCLQWLIDHGANVTLRNNMNETPLDVAKKIGNFECITLLGGSIGLDTEEDIDSTPQSLEEAKEQVEKYKKAFDIAKEQYKELGGVVNDEFETKLREAKEHHSKITETLESQLEIEREKREQLEKEIDELREKLYQANENISHYQSVVSTNKIAKDTSFTTKKSKNQRHNLSKVTM